MGFSCMKEHGFQSALGGSLKMDGTFSHLSKFVCLKATESKWAFSVVSRSCNHIFFAVSGFKQGWFLTDSAGPNYFRHKI